MTRSRWLFYGGLLGLFLFACPNVESIPLPKGKQFTFRLGTFSWLRYHNQEEHWPENGATIRRTESSINADFINISVFAGVAGLVMLAIYWRPSRRSPDPSAPTGAW